MLLCELLGLRRVEDYVLDFTEPELCWEDDINKTNAFQPHFSVAAAYVPYVVFPLPSFFI